MQGCQNCATLAAEMTATRGGRGAFGEDVVGKRAAWPPAPSTACGSAALSGGDPGGRRTGHPGHSLDGRGDHCRRGRCGAFEAVSVADVIDALERAPRQGAATDDPEGARDVVISETALNKMIRELRLGSASGRRGVFPGTYHFKTRKDQIE